CGAPSTAGADGLADLADVRYAPLGGQYRTQDFDRQRQGIALAGQWESNDGDSLLTAQFIRSHSTNAWGEHTWETAPDLSEYNTYPIGCRQNQNGAFTSGSPVDGGNSNRTTRAECPVGSFENYQYDEEGLFESGYITLPGQGWRSSGSGSVVLDSDDNPVLDANGNQIGASYVPTGGMQQSLSRRQVYETNTV